ncbi:MAG: LysM peptidoglycan-binding domain-containing protein [Mobilitalea sp.]
MIETIYSNENGEAKRTSKVQASFKMPKNVRQVGKGNTTKKIYVEDYVMTFIKQLAGGDYSALKIAVLVGQCIKLDNCRNIFISGAIEVENIDITNEIVFSNDAWTVIYEEIKKYFVEAEIVGWFIGGPGYLLEDGDKILKAHVDNFAGQDKTLLTYDNMEKEEAFLNYENNSLCKQEGYYIYYEKNEEMQTYIIEHKKGQSSEANYDDRVSRDLRTVLQSKKPIQEESKSITRLMYAAGTLLAVIILVVGAAMLSNYDQMKKMQETLNSLSKNMEEVQSIYVEDKTPTTSEEVQNTQDSSLNVEVVPGEVEPLEEAAIQSSKEEKDDNKDNDALSEEELADETDSEEAVEPVETVSEQVEDVKVIQEEVKYYTVVTGDTLAGISFKLYSTYTKVNKIMELNNIENQDVILVGQRLIVP